VTSQSNAEVPVSAPAAPLLAVRGLSKVFPGVVAVDHVDLDIRAGEILALLGQNGAGKSTLIQVLSGVHPAETYEGSISIDGRLYRPTSVSEAEAGGIAFLAQEVNVAPDMTVAEGMALNNEPTRFGMIDGPLRLARAKIALREFGLDIDPTQAMGDLDLATQQLVLIVRALSKNARVLILDEPSAALNEREVARLFERMRSLAARGVAIIFVSHRLAEVFEISSRIVVMRDGRISGEFRTSDTSRDLIVAQMVGSQVSRGKTDRVASLGSKAIEARGLVVMDAGGGARAIVDGIDLSVAHGEILGLFGLLGAGTIETAMALFGAWPGRTQGEIWIDSKPAAIRGPADAVRLGIGLIAQDRRDGLSGEHSIYDNAILASLERIAGVGGLLDGAGARRRVMDIFHRLRIKAASIDTLVGTLSGGNQQKVQVARWLEAGVKIILLVDPTRGVDVGARAEITRIWTELANAGCAILFVSSDAEELVEICDRVVVLSNGRVAGEIANTDLSEERLLRLAAAV
jgi:ABC-type sugar transport system ATPase subunit